ncbi:hypothetical protein BKA67DRAFT_679642 [Truncatella angustata]|uniref:Berberine/berberine-like domain-containing protein n=1 Tax=Truncatella angustata TaxID=152316 RepID=A0A9P8UFY3_9PEZI|nr:uncharacterized protein BKA67DRAFT_679642 [Truncatella angustata]KAH6651426.1 hypothetical protein BKA67DRAFT_679642 [Truncatella angustata]
MRGAGHNFGVVTSFEMKIYPATVLTYYYRSYIFTGDVLEDLFEKLNAFHGNGTLTNQMVGSFGVYAINPDVGNESAAITWIFVYAGDQTSAEPLLENFDLLKAVTKEEGNVPCTSVSDVLFSGLDSPLCSPNQTHIIGTAGLQVYNITTQRQLYQLFDEKVSEQPGLNNARLVHEGYTVEAATKRVHRYFDVSPEPGSGLEGFAQEWARDTIDLWNAGQPSRKPTTYVNYAAGHEPIESMYGYEPWRLERLRALKAQYDPLNKFAYYNPIIPPAAKQYRSDFAATVDQITVQG